MNTKTVFLIVLSVLSMTSKAQRPSHNFESKIEQFNGTFTKALIEGDIKPCLSSFDAGIRLMPPFNPTLMDKVGAESYYKAFLDRFEVEKYERKAVSIERIDKNRLIDIGNFQMQLIIKTSRESKELIGKYLNVWEVRDGHPKVITSIWNFDENYGPFQQFLKFEGLPGIITAFQTQPPVDNPLLFELAALNVLHGAVVAQHDGDRWEQFYNGNTFLLPNYYTMRKGRAQVSDYIQTHVKELPIFEKLDIRNDKVEVVGVYVFEYASHVANWRTGEYSGVSTGKNLRIWKRQEDCSLKIVYHMSAYD